ncbi:hypothetical protein M0R45_025940 [Rubus argutus]|uniref:Uncharacterized protein n=1 Tax=Rubus argutus TaxID=59490 RepID=A0AAW1WVI7_RUBAR
MSFILPPAIAIKAPIYNTYLNYTEESELSLAKFTGENVFSRTAKFEVLTAITKRGLVHIRCSHNIKFLRVRAHGCEYINFS